MHLQRSLFFAFVATVTAQSPSAVSREPPEATIQPPASVVSASASSASTLSPTSNVAGAAFNRIVQIWLENTDYAEAAADPILQQIASQGITLTNFWAITHPSEPNYAAVVGGDSFGCDNDDFHAIPNNVSTVVDLLDTKGISWSEYQETIPYAGYQGFSYSTYVRKHNPLILYKSVTENSTRLSLIKSLDSWTTDVKNQKLPQWSFITPNMLNDAHDTNITFAAKWLAGQLAQLQNNSYVMDNTLFMLTFDEIETYKNGNKIFALLFGGAIPANLKGTKDDTFYNHYSMISTVSANWGLPSLGRWDCEANVLALVADKTGITNAKVDTTNLYFNQSMPGPLSNNKYTPVWPAPATNLKCISGNGVLPAVMKAWNGTTPTYNYTNVYPYDSKSGLNTGGQVNGSKPGSATSASATPGLAAGTLPQIWAVAVAAFAASIAALYL